jgi:hypothetical protein
MIPGRRAALPHRSLGSGGTAGTPSGKAQAGLLAPAVLVTLARVHAGRFLCPADQGKDQVANRDGKSHALHKNQHSPRHVRYPALPLKGQRTSLMDGLGRMISRYKAF